MALSEGGRGQNLQEEITVHCSGRKRLFCPVLIPTLFSLFHLSFIVYNTFLVILIVSARSKNLWYTTFFLYTLLPKGKVKCLSLSRVRLFATPQTVANQIPLSMGFSRQEYWSGLPFPLPANLPDPGIKPGSPAMQADYLLSEPPGIPSCQNGRKIQIFCSYGGLLRGGEMRHIVEENNKLRK